MAAKRWGWTIQNLFWGKALRWREVGWFGRAWYRTWEWIFRMWARAIRPHLVPRRWERERHSFHEHMRIPARLQEAGTWSRDGSWTIEWHEGEPASAGTWTA